MFAASLPFLFRVQLCISLPMSACRPDNWLCFAHASETGPISKCKTCGDVAVLASAPELCAACWPMWVRHYGDFECNCPSCVCFYHERLLEKKEKLRAMSSGATGSASASSSTTAHWLAANQPWVYTPAAAIGPSSGAEPAKPGLPGRLVICPGIPGQPPPADSMSWEVAAREILQNLSRMDDKLIRLDWDVKTLGQQVDNLKQQAEHERWQ